MHSKNIVIAKIDAAERQLSQAVRLFFQRGDEISIHTLASAAYQITIDICEQKSIPRELEDSTIFSKEELKEILLAVRKPQNFFKHADKESWGSTISFNPVLSIALIVGAIQYYYAITKTEFPEGKVFRAWFFLRFPDRMPAETKAVVTKFPSPLNVDDYSMFLEFINEFYTEQQTQACVGRNHDCAA